jgi:transcriptional regulator with GAF, ATPase, and Fis domain
MGRKLMIVVSDDSDFVVSSRAQCEARGGQCKVYSSVEWSRLINTPGFAHALTGETPMTMVGGGASSEGAKILPFPGMAPVGQVQNMGRVQTIDQLESDAIRQAISNFRGNLTEAAKALGIGRATLYRKVKQYNIDPSEARRKKAA